MLSLSSLETLQSEQILGKLCLLWAFHVFPWTFSSDKENILAGQHWQGATLEWVHFPIREERISDCRM